MSVENRPEHHPHSALSLKEDPEMMLATTLRHLVDDIFTNQDIVEKLQSLAGGQGMEMLVENWKQGLTQHLYEATQVGIGGIIATLDLFQANPDAPVLNTEPHQWEDLRGILANEQIVALSDEEMSEIAANMSDAYHESGGYWESLMEIANLVTTEKQPIPTPAIQPDNPLKPPADSHDPEPSP
jgi:hypothetical protein